MMVSLSCIFFKFLTDNISCQTQLSLDLLSYLTSYLTVRRERIYLHLEVPKVDGCLLLRGGREGGGFDE